jgi:hypothetical protein
MDQKDDSIFPDNGHLNGTSEGGTTGSTGVSEAPAAGRATEGVAAGLRPGFLAELAVAMRATAQKERERIAARVADDAAAHVDKVRARAAIETDELKRLAEEDVQHIQDWSAAEMERIRGEADKKVEDRRTSLEEYLQQHDSIIDTEIEGVNVAVSEYSATLDRYFEELSQSDDPSTIVARAEALPAPPDLDQVRAQARSRAVAAFAAVDEAPPAAEAAPDAVAVADAPVAETAADTATETAIPADAAAAMSMVESAMTPEATIGSIVSEEPSPAPTVETPTIDENAPLASAAAADAVGENTMIDDRAAVAEAAMAGAAIADAQPEPVVGQAAAEDPAAAPIPVMDPTATAESSWPAPEATPEPEPEPVATTVDHQSAAVRLLRSVAPWTAPTHAGSATGDRSDSE